MEHFKKRKKVLYGFIGFLIFMFLGSLISKGVYASGLTQVDTVTPISQSILHEINVQGSIKQGKETALQTISGLRIVDVSVRLGQQITKDDPIFTVDMEDLTKQIVSWERAIHRIQLQIEDAKKNNQLLKNKQNTVRKRAEENYQKILKMNDIANKEAQEQYAIAWKDLEEFNEAFDFIMAEIKSAEVEEEIQVLALKKQQLETRVKSTKEALEYVITAKEKALLNAGRILESAKNTLSTSNTIKLAEMELQELIMQLDRNKLLLENKGKVNSTVTGIISSCNVQVGGVTSSYPAYSLLVDVNQGANHSVQPFQIEVDIMVPSGIRVKQINYNHGDYVVLDETLFEVEISDVKAQIRTLEKNIEKSNLQISDLKLNNYKNEQQQILNIQRAQEDYNTIEIDSNKAIQEAEKNYKIALEELDIFEKTFAPVMKEVENVEIGNEYKALLDKLVQLEENIISTKKQLENTQGANEVAIDNARLQVEDANQTSYSSTSIEEMEIDLLEKKESLENYKVIKGQAGRIYSSIEGIVIETNLKVGDKTTEYPFLKIAEKDQIYEFTTSISEEQTKYVKQGDGAKLTLSSEREFVSVKVDYIVKNQYNEKQFDITVILPEGVGIIGEVGNLNIQFQTERFSLCIPSDAITKVGDRMSVFIISQKESILGTELAVRAVPIQAIDYNKKYTAIEEGLINSSTEIVIDSTKFLNDGESVRYREW